MKKTSYKEKTTTDVTIKACVLVCVCVCVCVWCAISCSSWPMLPLKMGQIGSPETAVTCYQSMTRNIPEDLNIVLSRNLHLSRHYSMIPCNVIRQCTGRLCTEQ